MPAIFDHEKLQVYQLELQFIAWASALVAKVAKHAEARTSDIIDHLNRASLSALLNTAEGNGKRQRQTRAKFFDDARAPLRQNARRRWTLWWRAKRALWRISSAARRC